MLLTLSQLSMKVLLTQDEPICGESEGLDQLVCLSKVFLRVNILKLWSQFPNFIWASLLQSLQALPQDLECFSVQIIR